MTVLAAHDHDLSSLGLVGWLLVGLAGLGVAWTIWRAVVLTLRPQEEAPDHVKHSILREDEPPPARPPEGRREG